MWLLKNTKKGFQFYNQTMKRAAEAKWDLYNGYVYVAMWNILIEHGEK